MSTSESAARARAALAAKPPDEQAHVKQKIGEGVKRAAAKRRVERHALRIIREAAPDLDAGARAIVVILESDDDA